MTTAPRTSSLTAALISIWLAGCGSPGNGDDSPANGSATVAKHYEGPKPEGVSSPNDAVTTTFFIPQAAISDMYEIEASELAMVRAKSSDVRDFARRMVADHRRTSAMLKQFVADNPVNITIPQNVDARRRAMLTNLNQAGDDEFDAQYVGQQAAAHLEAYNLHMSYSRRGDYPALRPIADKAGQIVAEHRRHVEALDKAH